MNDENDTLDTPPSTSSSPPKDDLRVDLGENESEKQRTNISPVDAVCCRGFNQKAKMFTRLSDHLHEIKVGFVPGMKVPGQIVSNRELDVVLLDELKKYCSCCQDNTESNVTKESRKGLFLPSLQQMANVATLSGIVKASMAMPDVHAGYGFCIGNVAAIDMDREADGVVSPGGVGFDINCGVRLIRTNLVESDISTVVKEELVQSLFNTIPVGSRTKGMFTTTMEDLDDILEMGMDWALKEGYAWPEDKEHCEENGRASGADASKVSQRAKKRGLAQLGTLGGGNHYCEVQVVEEIYDPVAASRFGIGRVGQVCVMLHSGSRGLGHQVATDTLMDIERSNSDSSNHVLDPQLACSKIHSTEGRNYLASMSAAANFAWANRSCMTHLVRKAFAEQFHATPEQLEMHLVYDVSHNVAKVEEHALDGGMKTLLVHRKGATRAFPPHHPLVPIDYQFTGQPVLVGGSMGTCSYVLGGTVTGMNEMLGSTCHGAGRALSRLESRDRLNYRDVLQNMADHSIALRVASPNLIAEEAPEAYKDINEVIQACTLAGISRQTIKLRPIAVIKG
jgi:tRNA-splicing ligase RtcB